MIEEIKKEIEPLLVLDDVLYCKDCGSRNIKKSYKPYKIGENIMKILDKYKDKEIKFDDGSSKYAVVKVPVVQIKNKYKKVWEELKEYITKENITIQGVEVLEQEDLIDKMEELEQKYNLGGE